MTLPATPGASIVLESATELMMRHGPAFGHLLGVADMVVHGAVEVALVDTTNDQVTTLVYARGVPAGSEFLDLLSPQYVADLIAWCRQHLASFKCPRTIVFSEIPKTSTGKIQKFKLRESFWEGAERQVN